MRLHAGCDGGKDSFQSCNTLIYVPHLLPFVQNCHTFHVSAGFDSVVAKGVRGPDPSRDKVLQLEGRPVKVPVGPSVPAQQFAQSSFLQVS